jgi:hypothetical protein
MSAAERLGFETRKCRSCSTLNHLWRPKLFANRVFGMNPSKEDEGRQDEKQDRTDSEKTRLVPADLDVPEGDEEKHEETDLPPAMPPKV